MQFGAISGQFPSYLSSYVYKRLWKQSNMLIFVITGNVLCIDPGKVHEDRVYWLTTAHDSWLCTDWKHACSFGVDTFL